MGQYYYQEEKGKEIFCFLVSS